MKFCQPHWVALGEGVKARGMWHLVPQTAEEAAANLQREVDGGVETFDPLMGAHWRIANRVLDNIAKTQGPGAALAAVGDPDFCPLCAVQISYESYGDGPRPPWALDAQGWIDVTLDGALNYAREQGLVPGVQ